VVEAVIPEIVENRLGIMLLSGKREGLERLAELKGIEWS
jgi:hypothetical protein